MYKCLKCQKSAYVFANCQHCAECYNQDPETARARFEQEKQRRELEETNMINAQEWLNEKFPTKESKEKIKRLSIDGKDTSDYFDGESYYSFGVVISGELDLSDFKNLESYVLKKQPNLN